MEHIVKIEERDGKQLVSARELHLFLEVKSRFNDWIRNRIDQYDLIDDVDHTKILVRSINGLDEYDYALTVSCAKELSMVENNEKGKQARRYFIDCEKRLIEGLGKHAELNTRLLNIRELAHINELRKEEIDAMLIMACERCKIDYSEYMLSMPDLSKITCAINMADPHLIDRYLNSHPVNKAIDAMNYYNTYSSWFIDIMNQPEKSCISRHKFYRELRIKGYDAYRTRYGSYLVEKIKYY